MKKKRTVEFKDDKGSDKIEDKSDGDGNREPGITQKRDVLNFSVNDRNINDGGADQEIIQRRFGETNDEESKLIIDTGAD